MRNDISTSKEQAGLRTYIRADMLLLLFTMIIYLGVRFIGITQFPIYFFCDEAIQTNLAQELLLNNFQSKDGHFLPTFFRNAEKFSLSTTVYIQAISVALFGISIEQTRGTSALVSALAGIAIAIMLRRIFKIHSWWLGVLLLSALPVWFLHSRTAFETVMMVAFYGCFLCCYLLYRYENPRWAIPAVLFGGATFYSYTNGQGVMRISAVLLFLSDLRYHLQLLRRQGWLSLFIMISIVLVVVPYVRFRIQQPDALDEHLNVMNSIWISDEPFSKKVAVFGKNYLNGLSPFFWFSPDNKQDLDRHVLKGIGNLSLLSLPLVLLGLWACIRHWHSSAHRAVLIAIAAAPFSASLVAMHNYRALAMVIPAALLSSLGLEHILIWLKNRGVSFRVSSAIASIGLVSANVYVLWLSLTAGPTWYRDYGLYGMQYGAMQVFSAVSQELEQKPEAIAFVSGNWANNSGAFFPFFLPESQSNRAHRQGIDDFVVHKKDIPSDSFFVMSAEEYKQALDNPKFVLNTPFKLIPYPDGQPGFYFVQLRYVDNIDEILRAEREARRKVVEEQFILDGQTVLVRHSLTDLGSMADLTDDDVRTLMRGFEANPFIFEFEFTEPRMIQGFDFQSWQAQLRMTVIATPANDAEASSFTQEYSQNNEDKTLFGYMLPNGPLQVKHLRIELFDINAGEFVKIHIPTLRLR